MKFNVGDMVLVGKPKSDPFGEGERYVKSGASGKIVTTSVGRAEVLFSPDCDLIMYCNDDTWFVDEDRLSLVSKDHSPDAGKMVEHDPVNHPKHYTGHPSGIECIQITEHMGFCLGNAVKYIWRADLKNDAIEDLKKAVWYINREIEKRTKCKPTPSNG